MAKCPAPTRSWIRQQPAVVGSTVPIGTLHWYWVKFTTNAGGYNSGSASVTRGIACAPMAITPCVNANGAERPVAAAGLGVVGGSRVRAKLKFIELQQSAGPRESAVTLDVQCWCSEQYESITRHQCRVLRPAP